MQLPSLSFEFELLNQYSTIGGVDEVGRGCLAGPVCACVALLNFNQLEPVSKLTLIRDSKTLSERQREYVYRRLNELGIIHGLGYASSQEIDAMGIRKATYLAMLRAYWALPSIPDVLLMDGKSATLPILSKTFQFDHGDMLHTSIAMASIIAKVSRDKLVSEYDSIYPGYGFASHKGYGTKAHYDALRQYGITDIHRLTFL